MLVIPAIDIIDGNVVRLTKGEYTSVINYANTPLEQAKIYSKYGFEWLHIVDLSGSKDGKINTVKIVQEIINQTNLKIEFGGGIRKKKDVKELLEIGVDAVIIGSLSITDKNEFESIFNEVDPESIIIAADVLDYNIRIKGWTENSNVHLFDHIKYCSKFNVKNYLCTDIAVDGMMTGPNLKLYSETIKEFPQIKLTASGGVSGINDIFSLSELPIRGIVVGKAIYENKINLEELSKIAL